MPRTVLLAFGVLLLGAIVLILTDEPVWQPGVTEANAARVREGMTMEEVQALLGGDCYFWVGVGGAGHWDECHRWEGMSGGATVCFSSNLERPRPRVRSVTFEPGGYGKRLCDRLRAGLGF